MKINRTFSIPVKLALRLKAVSNQSALVSRAIDKYLCDQEDFSIADIPLRQAMAALSARKDCPDGIKALISLELEQKTVSSTLKPPFRSLV